MKQQTPGQTPGPLPKLLKTKVFTQLFAALNEGNATTLMVGGVVRDFLLDKLDRANSVDIDLATTLLPDEVTQRCEAAGFKIIPIGLDHGTVMATKDGEKFEITTLREDVSTDGRRATVQFTTDFKTDASRRDFTFNALYMDDQGQITDFFNGQDDLKAGKVCFVGAPSQRLEEDWLRALRYFRFYARLDHGTRPDCETMAALAHAAGHLKHLSAERKTTEFLKIMAAPKAAAACGLMLELGYMEALGLEKFNLEAFKKWQQNSAETLCEWGVNDMGFVNLIAALWNPTRPLRAIEALTDNPHFTFSNAEKRLVRALAPYNTRHLSHRNPDYSAYVLGPEVAQVLFHLAALYSYVPHKMPALEKTAPQAPLSGQDLKEVAGLEDGKTLGGTLNELNRWSLWHNQPTKEAALKKLNQWQKTPASVLVIPDLHGNIEDLKTLLETPFAKQARAIVSLGDYLDANEDNPQKMQIIETANFLADLLENDERLIIIRANHEQVNAKMMRKALLRGQLPAEFEAPNKHNIMLLRELEKLSKYEQMAYMARQLDVFIQQSVDGVRLKLPNGETLAMTHGGWHVDIAAEESAVGSQNIGPHKLEVLNFRRRNMPKHARYEAMWGHWLAVPDDQGRADTAHLKMPPEGYTLIVGHHFSRRKNTLPERNGNIIFTDTGSGKGGQLTALQICLETSTIEAIAPDEKGGFSATPLKTTPHVEPFVRRIPGVGGGKSA